MSGHHAELTKSGATWSISDLKSTNGTTVNGVHVGAKQLLIGRSAGTPGCDLIGLGAAYFRFWRNGPISAVSAAPSNAAIANGKAATIPTSPPAIDVLRALKPFEFEMLIAKLFQQLGFQAIVTKQSGDDGIDVEATCHAGKTGNLVFRGRYVIQCKKYGASHKVGAPDINNFQGSIALSSKVKEIGARGIFITTSSFSKAAKKNARIFGITLINGDELVRLIASLKLG